MNIFPTYFFVDKISETNFFEGHIIISIKWAMYHENHCIILYTRLRIAY